MKKTIQHATSPALAAILDGFRSALVSQGVCRDCIEGGIAVIEGRAKPVSVDEYAKVIHPEPIEELQIVTRPQLAKLLKCGIRSIDYYRGKGWLKPVFVPGSSRARGYTAESVRALLRGDYAKEGKVNS